MREKVTSLCGSCAGFHNFWELPLIEAAILPLAHAEAARALLRVATRGADTLPSPASAGLERFRAELLHRVRMGQVWPTQQAHELSNVREYGLQLHGMLR